MSAINAALWHAAIILLFVLCGLDSFAWFLGGMSFMFWLVVVTLAMREVRDEQA